MAGDRPIALSARGLHERFGALQVLRGIDLAARHGEVIAMIGASGSGKSTLLRCLNLLEVPEAGEVEIAGSRIEFVVRRDGSRAPADARAVEIFVCAGAIYLVINFALTRIVAWLERRLSTERMPDPAPAAAIAH